MCDQGEQVVMEDGEALQSSDTDSEDGDEEYEDSDDEGSDDSGEELYRLGCLCIKCRFVIPILAINTGVTDLISYMKT